MRILKDLKPERVMSFFEDICSIPHGSGNTAAISKYCLQAGLEMGLESVCDEMGNVIIKKSASKGCEGKEPIILQAHLDMVCEALPEVSIDFATTPITPVVDGDFIKAKGTTLGGDDGIGVAMILAVLEDKDLAHPPIEALFTVDEETGMFGAAGLNAGLLSGRRLINIDTEEEGVFTVGCAGGASCHIKIPLSSAEVLGNAYEVTLTGLKGGHSGVEIHRPRYNANILLGRFLATINDDIRLVSISGGSKENAIPASATAVFVTKSDLLSLAKDFESANKTEEEPDLKISVKMVSTPEKALDERSTKTVLRFLTEIKNGVQKMSPFIEGMVQTSLNLGILKTDCDGVFAAVSVRSSVGSEKSELVDWLKDFANSLLGECTDSAHYPAWEYREESYLRDKMVEGFKELYGKEPVVEAIHAGLECGLLSEKLPGLDAVSFGANTYDIHTPTEKLSISSVERSYNFLCHVLEIL